MTASEWNFEKPPANPLWIESELARFLEEEQGIGFSANQMGFLYRVFAMRIHYNEPVRFFYNPMILETSDEMVTLQEGCLSFPGLFFKVKRPASIKVLYCDSQGNSHTEDMSGWEARCFQHELDHLNGVCFINKVSRLTLNMARKKLAKRERNN